MPETKDPFEEARRRAEEGAGVGVEEEEVAPPRSEGERLRDLRSQFETYRAEFEASDAWKSAQEKLGADSTSWLRDQYTDYLRAHWPDFGLSEDDRDVIIRAILETAGFSFPGAEERREAPPQPPPPPGFEERGPEVGARLDAAREAFIKAEQNWEKYLGLGGLLRYTGVRGEKKAAVEEELLVTREAYAEARAERVGEDIRAFLQEETTLADQRVRAAIEKKKGLWEKVSNAWKWMGDQNLEKLGWRPQGRFGRIIARGANLRTAVGLGLMGLSVATGPASFVAFGALGVRRAMAGTGATLFTSEWLGRRAEVSRTTLSDKELENLNLATTETRLGDMVVGLRMQGKLASESTDYQKLLVRYENLLAEEHQRAGNAAEFLREASLTSMGSFAVAAERGERAQDLRRGISIAAGVGAAIGVAPVLRYLYGAQEIAPTESPRFKIELLRPPAPPPGAEQIVEMEPPTPEAVALSEEARRMVGELLPGEGVEPSLEPSPPTGVFAEGVAEMETPEARITALQAEVEALQKQIEDIQVKLHAEEVQGLEAAAEAPEARLPGAFEITVQYGEGPLHEIRKAVGEYIALSGDPELQKLTKAQRLWVEETLLRKPEIKAALPSEWKVGAKISLPSDVIGSVLNEAEGQSQEKVAAMGKNLTEFVGRVNWPRYEVQVLDDGSTLKPWEWDEGIRKVSKAAQVAVGEVERAPVGEWAREGATITFEEAPRYVPLDVLEEEAQLGKFIPQELPVSEAGEGMPTEEVAGGVRVEELVLAEDKAELARIAEETAKAEALKEVDPGLAQRLVEESRDLAATEEATWDAAAERVAYGLSRLDPEEYRAIKDLKVSEALRKTFWGTTDENRWPSTREPNHLDLWRKGKLKNSIAYVLEHLVPQEREHAAGLTIHRFIQEYYLERK